MSVFKPVEAKSPPAAREVPAAPAAAIGRLAAARDGEPRVIVGNRPPCAARHVAAVDRAELLSPAHVGREVLLVFEDGDPARPIVTAFMAPSDGATVTLEPAANPTLALEARLDGRRVVLEAGEEILIRCGKGYIRLHEDGRIVIKGTDVLSRSTGVNKIKGGAVRIN